MDRQFCINKDIILTDASPAFVIAEVGHNHEGDVTKAIDLILSAKGCGCHAVKTQKRNNRLLYTQAMYDAPYENEFSYGKTYGEHREALELSIEDHRSLKEFADELEIIYFATPFDMQSLKDLVGIGVDLLKVASADLKSIPFLRAIGATRLPVILSTGGGTLQEIAAALQAIGHDNVAILHCVATYPTRAEECNMACIKTLRDAFPRHVVGLSDHYPGILSAIVARLCGAGIIEKHFMGDAVVRGTDSTFSLNTHKMTDLMDDLDSIDEMRGDGVKRRLQAEDAPLRKMGKGIYAVRDIAPGETITEKNVAFKSPAAGIGIDRWDDVIGRPALCCIDQDQALDWRMLGGNVSLKVSSSVLKAKAVL